MNIRNVALNDLYCQALVWSIALFLGTAALPTFAAPYILPQESFRVTSPLRKVDVVAPVAMSRNTRDLFAANTQENHSNKSSLTLIGNYPTTVEGFLNAIRNGDNTLLAAFVAEGVDINGHNTFKTTPLMAAAGAKNLTAVEELLGQGANPNLTNNRGDTALHIAIREDAAEIAIVLMKAGADINAVNGEAWTPLFYAVTNNNMALAVYMVSRNGSTINVNRPDRFGLTPLMLASRNGANDIVGLLLRAGARINVRDIGGNSPLIFAVKEGHIDIVQQLLEAGANANDIDATGTAVIDIALAQNHLAVANLLLGYGAQRRTTLGR